MFAVFDTVDDTPTLAQGFAALLMTWLTFSIKFACDEFSKFFLMTKFPLKLHVMLHVFEKIFALFGKNSCMRLVVLARVTISMLAKQRRMELNALFAIF